MMPAPGAPARGTALITRYSHAERLTHWAVAVGYVALFLSGLALFHPFFFWTSSIFGSAALMRVLHPWVGAAFFLLFYAYALRLVRDNLWLPSDSEWVRQMLAYVNKKGEPRVEGKYNAGQKLMFWSMIAVIAVLFLTGLALWRSLFPGIPIPLRRWAAVIHSVMAFIMFVGIGIHVYAAYWTKGSVRAMTRGTVTRPWARFHHPGWYEKVAGKDAS